MPFASRWDEPPQSRSGDPGVPGVPGVRLVISPAGASQAGQEPPVPYPGDDAPDGSTA